MKKNQFLLVTMFTAFLSWQVNAQEISVVYSARINTASEELFKETGLPEDMRRALINAYSKVDFSYGLTYANNESTFQMLPSNKKQEISFMGQTMDLSAMTEGVTVGPFKGSVGKLVRRNKQYYFLKIVTGLGIMVRISRWYCEPL